MSANPLEDAMIQSQTIRGFLHFIVDLWPERYARMLAMLAGQAEDRIMQLLAHEQKAPPGSYTLMQLWGLYQEADDGNEEAEDLLLKLVPPDKGGRQYDLYAGTRHVPHLGDD